MPLSGDRLSHPATRLGAMTDHDVTDGGQSRIVSEDQAAKLREQVELLRMFEKEIATGGRTTCFAGEASRLEEEDARWDQLGEESQDPGSGEPA